MNRKINHRKQGIIALALLALLTVGSILFARFEATEANSLTQCPNGPLRANLTGAAISGDTPSGTAQYNEKSGNELMVRVRSVNLPANTTISVFIGDTNVGQMTIPGNGNAQLKVDSASGITEGTVITIRNGETTILTGSFVCVAGNNDRNGNTNVNGNVNTNGNTNANGNTNGNTNTGNTNTNTNTNTSPTVTPTLTPTLTPTVTPTPTV